MSLAVSLALALGLTTSCVTLTHKDAFPIPATPIADAVLAELSTEHWNVRRIPITVEMRTLSAYYSHSDDSTGVVILCGGSGNDVEAQLRVLLPPTRDLALDLVVFPYYTKGEAIPSVSDTLLAVQTLYENVARLNPTQASSVYLCGHSLGAYFALSLASTHSVKGLVLAGPCTNAVDLIHAEYGPLSRLIRIEPDADEKQLDARAFAPRVMAKTLVVSSDADEAVPAWLSKQVYALLTAAESRRFEVLRGVTHGAYFRNAQFWEDFRMFFGLPPGKRNGPAGPIDVWRPPAQDR